MSVTIGHTTFNRVRYDARGDVLYMHAGEPSDAVDFHGASEGHGLGYDAHGRLVRLTLLNARWSLDRDGEVRVTFPDGQVLTACREDLAPVLASPAA